MNITRTWVALATTLALAGCASFSPDGGFGTVSDIARERTGVAPSYQRTEAEAGAARQRLAELLKEPLSAERAVETAYLNNRGLQASLAELGIAESELVRAGRLRNPAIGFGRMREAHGVVEIERSVTFDVLGLLTLPIARATEEARFKQAQLQAADAAVSLAADVRRSFFTAVAAQETVRYFERVKEAADASSELAQRMLKAGNFSKLSQMREQAFQADAVAQLARARHQAVAERERLARLLGTPDFKLPERLPDLPAQPDASGRVEQFAMDKRLDVQMARRDAESLAKSLGLTRATRFINVLHVGYQNRSMSGEPRANGYEIELELPIFDFGATRSARAEAAYMQAVHRTADIAQRAQSEVREAHSAYLTAYELARHYRDEIVPLRKRISEENLLRYNGMLIGVFELLADAREQTISVTGYVDALRDFWITETQLQTALTGRSPNASPAMRPSAGSASASGEAH